MSLGSIFCIRTIFSAGGFNSQVQQMSRFHYATNLIDSEYIFIGVA